MKKLEVIVSHTGLVVVPVPTNQTGKILVIHQALDRVNRSTQQWRILSPKVNIISVLPNKFQNQDLAKIRQLQVTLQQCRNIQYPTGSKCLDSNKSLARMWENMTCNEEVNDSVNADHSCIPYVQKGKQKNGRYLKGQLTF